MKPRLKRYFSHHSREHYWVCSGLSLDGIGETPEVAYKRWAFFNSVPQGALEKARKILTRITNDFDDSKLRVQAEYLPNITILCGKNLK